MRYQNNWDDLGRSIREEVDRAVGSQNYQHLNQTIRQAVETAVDIGGEAVRRAQNTAKTANQAIAVRRLYGPVSVKQLGAAAKTFFGYAIGGIGGLAALGLLMGGMVIPSFVTALAMAAGGGWMAVTGSRRLGLIKRFKTYKRILGTRTHCGLEKLARAVGKDVPFVRKDVTRMIGEGYFLEGHMDHEQTNLITSDDTYQQFEQARLQLEQVRRQQEAAAPDQRVREVLDKGSAFVAQIRKCNDDIPGEEISAKIDRIEQLVRRIFQRAAEHPEVVPDLKKLMDYYLPMTVKLLTAYAQMDAQPVRSEKIEASKREIEATLDTLNVAFEKLLDELFRDTILDISSDISVLNSMLASEGLTDDELTKLKREGHR